MKSRLVSTVREVRLGQEAKQVRLKLIRSNRLCGTDICCNPEQAFVTYSVLCFGPSFERRRPSQHKFESLFACDCSRGGRVCFRRHRITQHLIDARGEHECQSFREWMREILGVADCVIASPSRFIGSSEEHKRPSSEQSATYAGVVIAEVGGGSSV